MASLNQASAPDAVIGKGVLTSVILNSVVAHFHRHRFSETDGIVTDNDGLMNIGHSVGGNSGVIKSIGRIRPNVLGGFLDVGDMRGFNETHIFDPPDFASKELAGSAVIGSVDPSGVRAEVATLVRIDETNVRIAVDLRSLVSCKQLSGIPNEVDVEVVRRGDTGATDTTLGVQNVGRGEERIANQTITILGVVLTKQGCTILQGLNRGRTKQHFTNLNGFDVLSDRDGHQAGTHRLSFHSRSFCDVRLAREGSIPEELDGVTGKDSEISVDLADSLEAQNRLRAEENVLRVDVENDVIELDVITGRCSRDIDLIWHCILIGFQRCTTEPTDSRS